MVNFIAMDFETASSERYNACLLALIIVRNGQIADEFYTLVDPHTKFFWRNTRIHGTHEHDVQNMPDFPEVWEHINQFYTPDKLAVAHNNRFGNSVLRNMLEHYNIEVPAHQMLDIVASSRQLIPGLTNYRLNTVCDTLNTDLYHHHDVLNDA